MPKVYVEVYGCSANRADAEIASGLLMEAGHTIVDNEVESDVSIILTCIVKTPTEKKIVKRLRKASNRKLVVAGCMPKALMGLVEEAAPEASMVGPDDVARIPEAVDAALGGGKALFLNGTSPDRTCLPRHRRSNLIHIEPISTGCLGNCSYCIVKLARGKLLSFSRDKIKQDIANAVGSGCKEVWITAEDTAAYDANGIKLPELLQEISEVEGDFRIRVGMMTPNSALQIADDLVDAFKGPKVFKFLHSPVQSGSDRILKKMRRRYTVAEFRDLVSQFRNAIPGLSVSTDIICGFTGETQEEFQESMRLIEWLRPDALNISRFWPRPGTEASNLDGALPGWKTKERSRNLNRKWRNISVEVNSHWIGWQGEVLLDEEGHHGMTIGRNSSYKAIALPTKSSLGEYVKVRVTKVGRGYLFGEEII